MSGKNGDRGDGSNKLRAAKKQIESLKKEIHRLEKELSKQMQFVREAKNLLAERDIEYENMPRKKKVEKITCESCGKGTYESFSLTIGERVKIYHTCDVCGHRKVEG
jgi:formylmethanofuran dehydrogenase subunit E